MRVETPKGKDYYLWEAAEQGWERSGFSDEQIADLERTQQDYLTGKTTARAWNEIKQNLNRIYR